MPRVSRTGACGVECLHTEWPVIMFCDGTDLCLERVLVHFGEGSFTEFCEVIGFFMQGPKYMLRNLGFVVYVFTGATREYFVNIQTSIVGCSEPYG